ncbi:MAG: PEP/pyruvate-binding domain-containing protein [Alistipes indistinctus]
MAIRSSSKLEDSHYQPFAGIYSTYMIPKTDNEDQMLRLLGKAVKSVYASVYFAASRAYIQASSNLLSEEKMAVVIQDVCGTEDSGYFFPTISGVARSLNFYPIGDEQPQDGIVNLAFGLGKLVVEGGLTLRFSPRYPRNVLQLSTTELALRIPQREMYALNLRPEEFKTSLDDAVNLQRFEINKAKHFRNMRHVASTWDMQNQRISDSNFEEGRKIVTFSQILKYDTMPLAGILSDMLALGEREIALSGRDRICRQYGCAVRGGQGVRYAPDPSDRGQSVEPFARLGSGGYLRCAHLCRERAGARCDRRGYRRGLHPPRQVRYRPYATNGRRGEPAQYGIARPETLLCAGRSGPLGIERSVARRTGQVAAYFRGESDRRVRAG